MRDRNVESSKRTVQITRVLLDIEDFEEFFPDQEYTGQDHTASLCTPQDKLVGCILLEDMGDREANVHIYFFPECRSIGDIRGVARTAPVALLKYVQENGWDSVSSACDQDDTMTLRLMKLLGFKPKLYWHGSLTS